MYKTIIILKEVINLRGSRRDGGEVERGERGE